MSFYGLPFRTACGCAGVGESTFFEWRSLHPDFEEAVQTAECQAQDRFFRAVEAGFERKPELALECLARRWPGQWSRPEKPAVVGTVNFESLVELARASKASVAPRSEAIEPAAPPTGPDIAEMMRNSGLTLEDFVLEGRNAPQSRQDARRGALQPREGS